MVPEPCDALNTPARGCAITLADGCACPAHVDGETPLALCCNHLREAFDWVSRDVGATDALPSPCLACGSRLGVRYPSGWLCAICEWKAGDIPDHDAFERRLDVVYYISYLGRIKIGTSANPRRRLAGLPYDELLGFERGDRLLERRRHAEFASYRIPRTEWFEPHEALSAHVAQIRAGVEDPWARYSLWVSSHIALHG